MKISKLKYVFAFVLMVAISTLGCNVKAVGVGYNGTQLPLSKILESQLSSMKIVDGDPEPGEEGGNVVSYAYTLYTHNTGVAVGSTGNAEVYTAKISGMLNLAYSTNPASTVASGEGTNTYGTSMSSTADKKVGLAILYGNSVTSASAVTNGSAETALGVQAYIWSVLSGTSIYDLPEGPAKQAAVNCEYIVTHQMDKPSYTYYSANEAKAAPIEMKWNAENGRYEYTVSDANQLNSLQGVIVNVSNLPAGIQCSRNGNEITFYATEQIGSVNNPAVVTVAKTINNGMYVPAYITMEDGTQFVTASTEKTDAEYTYLSLYTNALRVKVTKTLGASAENSKTGDATVQGAVYGLYTDSACANKVAELVIGADGTATSEPLEIKDYYVKEIAQPAGTKIDTRTIPAKVSAATTESNGQKLISVSSEDKVIYGALRMILSKDQGLTGKTTKLPKVGSKVTLTLDSDASQKYEAVVDEDGYADFTNIPYGKYTLREVESNVKDQNFMDDMVININEESTKEQPFQYSKLVNTEVAQRYVQINKYDAESEKLVTATTAEFEVRDADGIVVTQFTKYPTEQVLSSFTTGKEGWVVLPQKLAYTEGKYTVYEINAPEGYYNQSKATNTPIAEFTIPTNQDGMDKNEWVQVNASNKPQKMVLTINTKGQTLVGADNQTLEGQNVKNLKYGTVSLPGTKYEIIPTEDVVTGDGTVHYEANKPIELVDEDGDGVITTELYIGTYTLRQTEVAKGYQLSTKEETVVVEPMTQTIEKTYKTITYSNLMQEYDVNLTKEFGELQFVRANVDEKVSVDASMYNKVLVGVYAAEDIKNIVGTKILDKDTLITVARMGSDGTAVVKDLPQGSYYVKELATDDNYELSTEKYPFVNESQDNTSVKFDVTVDTILNNPKMVTTLKITKVESVEMNTEATTLLEKVKQHLVMFAVGATQGTYGELDKNVDVILLEGADFRIDYMGTDGKYYPVQEKVNGKLKDVVRTTDKNGEIVIEGLPFGSYAATEIKAPTYYNLAEKNSIAFELTTEDKEADVIAQDERTMVELVYTVKNDEGEVVEGVEVNLVDPVTNEVVATATSDEKGKADFGTVRAGRYTRTVGQDLDPVYVPVSPRAIELTESEGVIEKSVTVKFVKGSIIVRKTDEETGDPIPGFKVIVKDAEGKVVAEGVTDENGEFRVDNLKYGEYTVTEVEAPEGYELAEDLKAVVSLEKDGAELVVALTAVNTGDIAVALYAILALVSAGAIATTVKKMKRN